MKRMLTALLCLCICVSTAVGGGQAEAGYTPGPDAPTAEALPERSFVPNQFTDVSFFGATAALLRSNGSVRLVGGNAPEIFSPGFPGWSGIRDLAVLSTGIAGLTAEGRVLFRPYSDGDFSPELGDWTDVCALTTGRYYLLGLREDGTVLAAAASSYGGPAFVESGELREWENVLSLAANEDFAAAVLQDGTVRLSSSAPEALREETAAWQNVARLSIGDRVLAGLCEDGTVLAAGCGPEETAVVSGWKHTKDVAVLQDCVLAIDENGRLLYGLRELPPYTIDEELGFILEKAEGWEDLTRLFAGTSALIALRADGSAVACGDGWTGTCDVEDWTDITAISAQSIYSLGLRADGTVISVGGSDFGKLLTDSWTDVKGVTSSYGLDAEGRLLIDDRWGPEEGPLELRTWKDVVQMAGSVGLDKNGRILMTEDTYLFSYLEEALDWEDVTAIAAGEADDYLLGLHGDGTVSVAGPCENLVPYDADDPQSAIDATCDRIRSWTDVTAIAAGRDHALALKADGTVEAVGCDDYGQCGVSAWRGVVAVAAADCFSVGLLADGTVVTCGQISYSIPLDLSDWTEITAIAAGMQHVLGLRADGTVLAAGFNSTGACNT
ncbi:MAG: hypothetical protein IJ594_08755 [Oscillospiraceae bacterium]|nr:hypothetical protein [Oscillospiraceae bacterium]